jgi:hypothetical protein
MYVLNDAFWKLFNPAPVLPDVPTWVLNRLQRDWIAFHSTYQLTLIEVEDVGIEFDTWRNSFDIVDVNTIAPDAPALTPSADAPDFIALVGTEVIPSEGFGDLIWNGKTMLTWMALYNFNDLTNWIPAGIVSVQPNDVGLGGPDIPHFYCLWAMGGLYQLKLARAFEKLLGMYHKLHVVA